MPNKVLCMPQPKFYLQSQEDEFCHSCYVTTNYRTQVQRIFKSNILS